MSEERLTDIAMKPEDTCRRRRGRPTVRRRDSVKRDLERTEVNSQEWQNIKMDGEDSSRRQKQSGAAPTAQGIEGEEVVEEEDVCFVNASSCFAAIVVA